jgi:hypothetical protein
MEEIEQIEKEAAKQEADFMAQIRAERDALEKIRDENRKLVDELKNLKAVDIMSGRADISEPGKAAELSPKEYALAALKGKI